MNAAPSCPSCPPNDSCLSGGRHAPVLLNEVIAALTPKDHGIYVDGTFGRGGYTQALLSVAATQVFGIDRDPDAIAAGQPLAARFSPRLTLLQGAFSEMEALLALCNVEAVDGIALDLGVSSPQLDEAERGFSFQKDGPLDMRMDRSGPTAADLVNEMEPDELADLIGLYGQERFARRVARNIAQARTQGRIERTWQLADIVRQSVPRSADGIDPATRTFQALRIAVNDELNELRKGLCAAERLLKPQGKLAIVSFHSLEDRVVKDFLRERSGQAPHASRHAPMAREPVFDPAFTVLTRKPQTPGQTELSANPRSRSARLRVAQRTESPAVADPVHGSFAKNPTNDPANRENAI